MKENTIYLIIPSNDPKEPALPHFATDIESIGHILTNHVKEALNEEVFDFEINFENGMIFFDTATGHSMGLKSKIYHLITAFRF